MVGYGATTQSLPSYKDPMINIGDGCHLAYSLPELCEIIVITSVLQRRKGNEIQKVTHSDVGYKRQSQTLMRALCLCGPCSPVLPPSALGTSCQLSH